MALVKLSKETLNFYAPRFEIVIDDQVLAGDISKAVFSVTFEEKVNEGASFTLLLHDEFDPVKQQFKWLDHPLFREGNRVAVKLGYSDKLFPMIIGQITSIQSDFFTGEIPTITITGQDLSYEAVKKTSPEMEFVCKSYGEIARIVAKEAKLTPIVDDTGEFEVTLQKKGDQSYYRFLKDLATKAGREFFVEGQNMYFIEPRDDQSEILTLELGKDIISFSPVINTTGLLTEVVVRGHNPSDPDNPIVGRAVAGSESPQEPNRKTGSQIAEERFGSKTKVITNIIVNSVEHANAIALAELNKASNSLIEGNVECIGIPQIRAGVNIRLKKMGIRFSGKYYVTGTTHTMDNGGYRTRFSVKRNAL